MTAVAAAPHPLLVAESAPDPVSLQARGLVVRYGPRSVLKGVDLDLVPGEVLGLLGPNGAGKTTLMRRLVGVLPSHGGTVDVAGADPATSKEARARIGYLPEEPPVYNDDTALRYVTYMATLAGIPRPRRRAAAREALERAGAADLAGRLAGKLSKGQRQRVGLAAAIVHEPAVLLLDEPTSGLDPLQRVSFRTLLRNLARTSAVLFSTHILGEAQGICDRVVILDQGSVVATRVVGGNGASRMRVRVSGADPASLDAALRGVPGVTDAVGGLCEIEEPLVSQSIVSAVLARGWVLLEMAVVPDDLEATFLRVVAGSGT
jgi:ABC-2 type transport system ATP-binding protein